MKLTKCKWLPKAKFDILISSLASEGYVLLLAIFKSQSNNWKYFKAVYTSIYVEENYSYILPISPYNLALRSRTEYISEKHLIT